MGHPRKNSLFPVAVSVHQAAACLGIRVEVVQAAVRNFEVTCYRAPTGSRKKILVQDLVKWVKTWRRA